MFTQIRTTTKKNNWFKIMQAADRLNLWGEKYISDSKIRLKKKVLRKEENSTIWNHAMFYYVWACVHSEYWANFAGRGKFAKSNNVRKTHFKVKKTVSKSKKVSLNAKFC